MILSNITQASKYLPSLNLTLANDRFTDFFLRAQEWLTSHIIGTAIETKLESYTGPESDDPDFDLRRLCQRVIAEKALLDGIPEMDLQLTEAGFAVQQNDNFTPASSARVDRFLTKLPDRIKVDVDAVVRCLWKNSETQESTYSDWRASDQFKYLTACFLPYWEEYNRLCDFNADSGYDAYYAALEPMAKEMPKVADYYVSRAEVERLLQLFRDGSLLEIHRLAICELKNVAVAAYQGDIRRARNAASSARDVMQDYPSSFPAFANSDAFNDATLNLDGGKMVNFL